MQIYTVCLDSDWGELMEKCFLCGEEKETRKVFLGRARGFSDLCFDCTLKFFKIEQER